MKTKKLTPARTKKKQADHSGLVLEPSFLLFCQDVLEGRDGSFSIVRLIDRVRSPNLPARFSMFKIVGEFSSNQCAPTSFLFQLRIVPPNQEDVMIVGPFEVHTKSDLCANRIVLNCQNFGLSSEGVYRFELEALDRKSKPLSRITRDLEVRVDQRIEVSDPTIV